MPDMKSQKFSQTVSDIKKIFLLRKIKENPIFIRVLHSNFFYTSKLKEIC